MQRLFKRSIYISWGLVIALILIGTVTSVNAAPTEMARPMTANANSTLNAKIYLTHDVLEQLFQNSISQQIQPLTDKTIQGIVGSSPAADQGWVGQIAHALVQPSVTLTDLTPQTNGINAGLKLSLYPGDPKPTNSHMLVTFSILNTSTIQVNSQAVAGSKPLMTGPLTTFQVPLGTLTNIQTTPTCGNANLELGLQIPLTGGQAQTTNNSYQANTDQSIHTASMLSLKKTSQHTQQHKTAGTTVSTYVEVPFSSLSTLTAGIGTLPINKSLEAKNIKLSIQQGKLVVTADIISIVFGSPLLKLGTATTTIEPQAVNGKLMLHVDKTTLSVLIFTFSADNYNQQIQQALNAQIGDALGNALNISNAGIGPNAQVPCAASDSLMLTGTTTIN
jgi:hypothetical protein